MAGMMLLALTRRPIGQAVTTADMGVVTANPGRAMGQANKLLRLAGHDWAIESVREPGGGYRLVRTDGGDGWAP
jgi:hypothetical protein